MSVTERWSRLATRILAPNPGPMTLDGTNTYVLRAPGEASCIVVDPGPLDAGHLDAIEAAGLVELVLLTHHHQDHVEAAPELARRTGAPVRALDPALCLGGDPLRDGETIDAAGVRVVVLATPGHTADSVCLRLPGDGPVDAEPAADSVLTGDTILGRGTTVIAPPDGSLGAYQRSLALLRDLDPAATALPAHGPALPSLSSAASAYLAHRQIRLDEVTAALASLGLQPSTDDDVVTRITDAVYPGIEPRFAAEASARAQLAYLAEQ